MNVKVKLFENGKPPEYANLGDAGMDVFSSVSFFLNPGERMTIPLGIGLEIEGNHVAWLVDKSSLPKDLGLHLMGGIIDSSYRGQIHATVINLSDKPISFERGRKIGQILIQPVIRAQFELVENLSDSLRGEKGFGSSGNF